MWGCSRAVGFFTHSIKSFLPDKDYLPIAMPTSDVRVLQVLTRQRSVLRRYSELRRVLAAAAGSADPLINADEAVVDARGNSRRLVKVGVGLGVVSAILKAFGAAADIELSTSAVRSVEYGYTDVVSDRVDLASLDSWLAQAAFRPGLRNITDLLAAEDVYVIVAALKARALSVSFLDNNKEEVEVELPAIKTAIGAKVGVTADDQRNCALTFRGEIGLTVAAKAAQLKFDENGFWVNERVVTGAEIRGIGSASYLRVPELSLDAGTASG
jgi:hypothetical protein